MPKMRGAIKLTGYDKTSGNIYWKGKKGVIHGRQPQKPGVHKDQPELKANYTTIGEKNRLAGKVSRILSTYASGNCETGNYIRMRKLLQKDPVAGRYLQIKRFEEYDGHRKHKLEELIKIPAFEISLKKNKVIVSFDIERHPVKKAERPYYFLRVILVMWNDQDDHFTEEAKRIKWIPMNAALPLSYDLEFKKPAGSREWLLLCCLERAEEARESRLGTDKYIRIVRVSSFDKKDIADHKAYLAEKNKQKEVIIRNAQEDEAVGPVVRKLNKNKTGKEDEGVVSKKLLRAKTKPSRG